MKLMVTGHRPKDLGGYSNNPTQEWIRQELRRILLKAQVRYGTDLEIISGMALGVDTWWAEEALALGVPLLAYVPFKDQDRIWPQSSKDHYRSLLQRCRKIVMGLLWKARTLPVGSSSVPLGTSGILSTSVRTSLLETPALETIPWSSGLSVMTVWRKRTSNFGGSFTSSYK